MNAGRGGPILQLTKHGAQWLDKAAAGHARETFRLQHCVRIPSLLEPSLLAWIQQQIARGTFYDKAHGTAATELCLEADASVGLLHFLVNDPALYELVEAIGDCDPIRSFFGRGYRHVPQGGHYHHWHGDVTADRFIGMSINLSTEPYEGGLFEIRYLDTDPPLASVHNVGPGDAILFRLGPTLEHRVTQVQGLFEKTAFAGWFRRAPDYHAELLSTRQAENLEEVSEA